MKYGSFEFGNKETAEKSVEHVLVASAVGTLLSRGGSERVNSPDNNSRGPVVPNTELRPTAANVPERKINPVRRSRAEKQQTIRAIALKQAVEASPSVAQNTGTELDHTPVILDKLPMANEQIQPVHSNQAPQLKSLSRELARNVEQSSTEELLRVADRINLEGTTLRRLYETNQIDHRGLVAIVKESLRGGDIKRAYKKAHLGAEAQQGRKIEMRHDDPAFITTDTRREISEYGEKRVEIISNALQTAQQSAMVTNDTTAQYSDILTVGHGYHQVRAAMRRKRIATISISILAAGGALVALTWFLVG